MTLRLLPLLALLTGAALAQSPGPTDPSGPRLEPAQAPAPAAGREQMDEQIRRGTLVDPREEVDGGVEEREAPEVEERRQQQPLEQPR